MDIINLFDYNIFIGYNRRPLAHFIENSKYSKIFVLVDENTAQHCLPVLKDYLGDFPLNIIEIPAGEAHKNIATCQFIWDKLMIGNADRNALLINLGGGVIGDMGGFCAGTFKRGIDFIQIPTTLLSQIDSSIGGKLGIDFADVKNSIGLFKNPKAVFIDPEFLKTLSAREIKSGFAEMIKHSIIADAAQWEKLHLISNFGMVHWEELIPPSLMIKKHIVEEDPFEKGIRKALNFGHTIGHAVESYFLKSNTPLLHGEAIAVGMICESFLSTQITGLSLEALQSIVSFIIATYDCPTLHEETFSTMIHLMSNDKKNTGSDINFSLIDSIGSSKINQMASREQIESSMLYYNRSITNNGTRT